MRWRVVRGGVAGGVGVFLLGFGVGCASPGPPLPPSLNLPAVVTDLAVTRVGDEVRLRWTTPAKTTDKLKVKGPIAAEICREVVGAVSSSAPRAGVGAKACLPVVVRVTVTAGASEASDSLPAALIGGAPGVLAYRVQLRNAVGRTAGASAEAFVASGAAPAPVEGLRATATKGGAMLEWKAVAGGDAVELNRRLETAPIVAAAGPGAHKKAKETEDLRLRVAGDPGGAVDRTAVTGLSYGYTAQRVRVVAVGGRSLEMRSVTSASAPVVMLDVFPPEAPGGLVVSPGFVGAAGGGQRPTIDLSWEPGMEAKIAGYRVYRRDRDNGAWGRLNSELVATPAYRDTTVEAGRRYGYRVTAVDGAGNESKPSGEVVETAPGQ